MISIATLLKKFAYNSEDNDAIRQEKIAAILIAGLCSIAGSLWAIMYYFYFGVVLTTFLPLSFTIIVGSSIIVAHLTKNHLWAVYAEIICIIYITSFIQWSIGGVFESGFVMAWAFCGPITALMFLSLRKSLFWLLAYFVNILITVIFDSFFVAHGHVVDFAEKELFFVMNLTFSSFIVFAFAYYFVSRIVKERKKANYLLRNILPASIANSLKNKRTTIAKGHDNVTVLFSDIVGFTDYSSRFSPEEVVETLDKVFFAFDDLTEKYGLEKIKTIGDAYMVAAGIPLPLKKHTHIMALMALDMLIVIENLNGLGVSDFSLRIGIHNGPLVAGVIGKSKFAYDIWGDTVNVASRMESCGKPNVIQVSKAVYEEIKDEFILEPQGEVEIKGKGKMEVYHLIKQKDLIYSRV